MGIVVETTSRLYNYYVYEVADARAKDWWLVSNPFLLLAIIASYYYFCTRLGPLLMKNRKPFKLKKTLMVYNLFQVLMSLYLVYRGIVYMLSDDFHLLCTPLDYSDRPTAVWIAESTWWYFFGKITELLDTIFFVLRKKYKQISSLHLYHHSLMATTLWIGVKYLPGGHATLFALLNSFVHVIMYSYYFLSGLGPKYEKYLWWKRHLTLLQLIQFVILVLHNVYPLFTNCTYPKILNLFILSNGLTFIYMFGSFYYKNYIKNDAERMGKDALNGLNKINKS